MPMKLRITAPSLRYASSDIPAGIVVFLVALPLCLGIALASGAPLFSGIIAGVIGGVVVSLFSGSELSVSGPAAGLTTVVASAIISLGSFPIFLTAVLIAGLMQLVIAASNAARLGDFIPHSVIKGMLAAIGISIILKQIPHAVGYDKSFLDEAVVEGLSQWLSILHDPIAIMNSGVVSFGALGITLACISIMILWEHPRIKRQHWSTILSGTLVSVVVGTLLNQIIGIIAPEHALTSSDNLVNLPILHSAEDLSSFFVFPDLSGLMRGDVWITALTIALIASIESILSVEAVDKMDPEKRTSDITRELCAQGIGNTVSGLVGGLPITSVIVRSSTNVYSGGRTRMSAFVHGITLALAVVLISGILNKIPLACLASILLMVGYKLASLDVLKNVWHEGLRQFVPFISTLVIVVAKDILVGVSVGLVVAVLFAIRSKRRGTVTCGQEDWHYLIRLNDEITFMHKGLLKKILRNLPSETHVVIDGTCAHYIDQEIIDLLHSYQDTAKSRAMNVTLVNVLNQAE